MSLIKNLVKETENKPRKKKKDGDKGSGDSDGEEKPKPVGPYIKSATDLQRLKLEKLMKNPVSRRVSAGKTVNNAIVQSQEKPVIIPEQRRERDYMSSVPTFVRNVMGSSAGAGSGEFHVYRHLRRKEYARQKNIQNQSLREAADEAYQQKLDDNKRAADERTAKKRAKRLKKKQRSKRPREQKPAEDKQQDSESSASASEAEAEEKAASAGEKMEETAEAAAEQAEAKPSEKTTETEDESKTKTEEEADKAETEIVDKETEEE
ncbi:hypothetical protein KR222_005436 [Zaprionus bogoriensis]|nr:hypothetical protein KR222_005436 [Zaprionus bogoriensis]